MYGNSEPSARLFFFFPPVPIFMCGFSFLPSFLLVRVAGCSPRYVFVSFWKGRILSLPSPSLSLGRDGIEAEAEAEAAEVVASLSRYRRGRCSVSFSRDNLFGKTRWVARNYVSLLLLPPPSFDPVSAQCASASFVSSLLFPPYQNDSESDAHAYKNENFSLFSKKISVMGGRRELFFFIVCSEKD